MSRLTLLVQFATQNTYCTFTRYFVSTCSVLSLAAWLPDGHTTLARYNGHAESQSWRKQASSIVCRPCRVDTVTPSCWYHAGHNPSQCPVACSPASRSRVGCAAEASFVDYDSSEPCFFFFHLVKATATVNGPHLIVVVARGRAHGTESESDEQHLDRLPGWHWRLDGCQSCQSAVFH